MNKGSSSKSARRILFLCLLSSGLLACPLLLAASGSASLAPLDQSEAGSLEIPSGFDWSVPVFLDGTWDIWWDKWIDPAATPDYFESADLKARARTWPSLGRDLFGYASYHKTLHSLRFPSAMGLSFRGFYSAYEVYVNGRLIGANGRIAKDAAGEIGKGNARYFYFSVPEGVTRLDIVILASNFSYNYRAGMLEGPKLGEQSVIAADQTRRQIVDMLFIGAMLVMGVYHIFLTLLRRSEKAPLYFGLFCLVMAFRTFVVTGEKLAFAVLPWFTVRQFLFAQLPGIYPILPFFLLFVYSLFRQDSHKVIVKTLLVLSVAVFIAGIISAPFKAIRFYNIVLLPGMFYIFFVLLRAWIHNRPDARLIGTGFLVLFALGLNDILNDMKVIDTLYLLSGGLFVFLFFQSVVLARRFSRAFFQVERLSRQLEGQNSELQNLDKIKDEILANTSHELKTPLNAIIGLGESLVDGVAGPLSEVLRRNIELIILSGRRLYAMVNDLLDFSRLKEKQLHLDIVPVDTRSVCNLVLSLSENIIPAGRDLVLRNELPPDTPGVLADPARLEQILFNLVSNAVKFTERGQVSLASSWTEQAVYIRVSDTGIGIAPDKQELIFESFRQADSSINRRFGGSGLGLAIARRLAQLQNGDIGLQSVPGEGSTFTVSLPRAPERSTLVPNSVSLNRGGRPASELDVLETARTQELQTRVQETALGAGRAAGILPESALAEAGLLSGQHVPAEIPARLEGTILVVDDEYINLAVLMNHLKLYGYTVISASSAAEALRLLSQLGKPDAMILDVMMPDMSGYELTREVRKQYGSGQLPIILLTARNQTADIVEGFNCGANDYLTKPFSRTELIARVKTHIDLAKINLAYGRFVPTEFLGILNKKSIVDIRLGEQVQRSITVLFSDIRAFTTLSESMSPEENFNFINSYMGRFGPVVRKHGGFVDKYIGDAIMAIFPGTAADAIAAAREMRHELAQYNANRSGAGYQTLEFGIGIHSGPVIMGTVGESERMDTTVISDIVNVAARLEVLTKYLQTPVLAVQSCIPAGDPVPKRYLGDLRVKGKRARVAVVELLTEVDASDRRLYTAQKMKQETAADFEAAVARFQQQDFLAAGGIFTRLAERNPEDRAAALYAERCRELSALPSLPEHWSSLVSEWVE